jgi:hypothetical protein
MCQSRAEVQQTNGTTQVPLRETCEAPGPRGPAPDHRDLFQDALPWLTHQKRGCLRAQGWPLLTA